MGFRRRGGEHWALRDLSLTVVASQMLGVIGGNGSGKTTLLQVVAGVIPPSQGAVTVQGRIASLVDLSAGFHRDLTGRENLLIGGVLLGLTRNEVRERHDEIIAFSGLDAATLDWPLAAYSAGMGLRLGFSLIVHTAPDVLLVDEVLAVGDSALPASVRRAGRDAPRRRNRGDARLARHDARAFPLRHGPPPRPRRARVPRRSGHRHRTTSRRATRRRGRDTSGRARAVRDVVAGPGRTTAARCPMTLGLREFVTRRELFVVLVERQLRLRAKRSVFGVIWPVIAPLLLLVLYTFVFGRVFDVAARRLPGLPLRGVVAVDVPRAVGPRRAAEHLVRAGSRPARAVPLRVPAARAGRRHGDPVPRAPRRVRRVLGSRPTTCRSHRSRCW